MRPRSMSVKGFTSFRDEQTVDFSDLDLFVLWGPTGSGKSSLLDAMTYALYGKVERVGDEPRQLISQGQPRMAVTLDFSVGDQIYRVARSTSAGGKSTARLERKEGEDWISHGEGADLIRAVNKTVTELIGLDYDAFTRSVILPQGKFSEFLTGDAPKRREILTELLGLELFQRMAQRSNEIAKNAKLSVDIKHEHLERDYEGVSHDALAAARDHHENTTEMQTAAEKLETELTGIEREWHEAQRSGRSVRASATEASGLAETFSSASFELEDHARDALRSETEMAEAKADLGAATKAAQSAHKQRVAAEKKWGSLEKLAALGAKADGLAIALKDAERAATSAKSEAAALEKARAAAEKATAALDVAISGRAAAEELVKQAENAHEGAHRSDLVGALVTDLHAGDPCPVCDKPLDKLPKFDRKALERAERTLATAVERMNKAGAEAARAETDKAVSLKAVENAVAGVTRCEMELANKRAHADALTAELKTALKSSITDAQGEIDRRSTELRALIEAEDDAGVLAQQAERELRRKELVVEKVSGKVTALRAKLSGAPVDGLFGRAEEAAPQLDLPQISLDDLPEDVQDLATIAGSAAKELQKLADDLTDLARSHDKAQERLLERARAALPENMSVAEGGLSDLIAQCRSMTKQVASEGARAEAAVKSLEERLKAKEELELEIDTQRAEHVLYAALGKELKSDRIVQFLQVEALSALALAGSRHLSDLSSTRYRLEYDDDKFFVVDAWNGDEKRSVKTLSGGETFLASLALALALSEQVQLLAVTERSRMESLFLDEGFGTLDAETLDVVIGGVRQLAGEDRLVGVVTHVPELAEAIPVRLQVSKSMRGSTVTRVVDESFVS